MPLSFLYSRHRAAWLLACVALVMLIAYSDYATGYELSLTILYLAPIFLATWILGRGYGITVSLLALAAWLTSIEYMGVVYAHPFYHFWDALIRIATWVIFVLLLTKLRIALAHADERFVAVLRGLDAAVYVSDMHSEELLYVNGNCRTAFGAGHDLTNLQQIEARFTPPPSRVFPSARLQTADGTDATAEFHDVAADRWYLIHTRAMRWIDGRMARLDVATDITQHKRIEELSRQQHEKLQFTSRLISVGEMASTLAHELNQPLAAIANYNMGCVRRLRAGDWDAGELLEAMEKGSAQAQRAGMIVQRVRELVRRREPQRTECDINDVITEIAHLIEIDAEKRGVQMSVELASGLPSVSADMVMLEQAILNLARNAIEAMESVPAGRRILVLRSRCNERGGVEIEVSDSGRGIPDALVDNLFTPFFTTKRDGMGIGLHICRSIAEFHDGRIWATRNAGAGSTFHFALPARA